MCVGGRYDQVCTFRITIIPAKLCRVTEHLMPQWCSARVPDARSRVCSSVPIILARSQVTHPLFPTRVSLSLSLASKKRGCGSLHMYGRHSTARTGITAPQTTRRIVCDVRRTTYTAMLVACTRIAHSSHPAPMVVDTQRRLSPMCMPSRAQPRLLPSTMPATGVTFMAHGDRQEHAVAT